MVYFGLTKPELLKLFLQHTEAVRNHVERYFDLDRPLYFTYTHLVCRTALLGNFHLTCIFVLLTTLSLACSPHNTWYGIKHIDNRSDHILS